MAERPSQFELQEALRFRPKIWWDPVPDWIFTHLDREVLLDLARLSMRLQRDMLEIQMRGIDEMSTVLDKHQG